MTSARHRAAERIAMIASATVGVLAVIAVLLVALLTSDKADHPVLGAPGSGQGGTGLPGAGGGGLPGAGASGLPGAATGAPVPGGNGPAVSGGDGNATAGGGGSAANLKAHFPVPPGATPSTQWTDPPEGTEAYDVHASLASVKSFYETRFSALGVRWAPSPTTTASTGKVVGWHGSFLLQATPSLSGYLSLDEDYSGQSPGVITIGFYFND